MPLGRIAQATPERSVEDREYILHVCESRDEVAFAELLQTMHPHATAFLRRYRGTETGVDDVMQQADLNAVKAFRDGKFDPAQHMRPWYFTLLTNASIDHNRRNARHSHVLSLDASISGVSGLYGLLATDDDPVAAAELEEKREQVRAAINTLPEKQQDGIELLYWKQMKYREIADELGISEGTVKSIVYSAKGKLRAALADAA